MSKKNILLLIMCSMILFSGSKIFAYEQNIDNNKINFEYFKEETKILKEKIKKLPLEYDRKSISNSSNRMMLGMNDYPTRQGVILVRDTERDERKIGFLDVGHAAIVYKDGYIVESLPSKGVVKTKTNWKKDGYKNIYGLSVIGTSREDDEKAAEWCYKKIGYPYNTDYFNTSTRQRFYCSQLVWAAYYDNFNVDISTAHYGSMISPFELIWSDKTSIIYKGNIE